MDNIECYKTSNNKHFGCPPRMADGRHFTDYRPSCHINNIIRTGNNVMNSFQYRLFLSRNASELMDINRDYACKKNCCGPCQEPYHSINTLPEVNKVKCDSHNCEIVAYDPSGLGQGRIFGDEEKCENVGQVNLPANGCAKPEDNLRHLGSQNNLGNRVQRNAVQGGGQMLSGGDNRVYN
tara:strand:- start:956 stop:1495 length:540 start_codon:yes stop_codon:yes gene_type:complete